MLRNISFLLLFTTSLLHAQSHRLIYEYRFVPDSTKLDSIITEHTRLEIFRDHSEFLSEPTAKRDSAIVAASKVLLQEGKYRNKVYKSPELTYSLEFIGIQPFKVRRKVKLDWQLLKETKTINGYNCQKAAVKFGKREWEAWFTQEIPYQEGPHIFGNLPGMIVALKDTKGHHSFTLVANYKTTNSKTNLVDKPFFTPVDIDEVAFRKRWNAFRKNPEGATEQLMLMNPNRFTGQSFTQGGGELDRNMQRLEEREKAHKLIKKNNNFLDLALYE